MRTSSHRESEKANIRCDFILTCSRKPLKWMWEIYKKKNSIAKIGTFAGRSIERSGRGKETSIHSLGRPLQSKLQGLDYTSGKFSLCRLQYT